MCTSTFCLPLFLACTNTRSFPLFNNINILKVCARCQSSVLLSRGLSAVVKFYCPLWLAFLLNTCSLNSKYHSQNKYLNPRQLCQQADLVNGMLRLNHTISRNSKPRHIPLYETGTSSTSNLFTHYTIHRYMKCCSHYYS